MPIRDFRCEAGHEYEAFRHQRNDHETEPCEECGAVATRIYKAAHSYGGLTQPLVVWQKPDGTYSVPAQADARMPAEYTRVELRNIMDVRRVERAINQEEYRNWEMVQSGKQRQREEIERSQRSELRRFMQHGGSLVNDDGTMRTVGPMSERGRDFARYAMQRNNERERPKYKGVFHFEAFSMDASNREDGRNRDGSRARK